MQISSTQALRLYDYFKAEQAHGYYADLDLTDVNYMEFTDAQRRLVWACVYNGDKEGLIKFLYSVGAKTKK